MHDLDPTPQHPSSCFKKKRGLGFRLPISTQGARAQVWIPLHLLWLLSFCQIRSRRRGKAEMKRLWLFFSISCLLIVLVCGIESPEYTLIHSESDFQIRLYRESAWMSAASDEISFEKATKNGFHRLFQYIQGANLNWSRIAMTAPVLTTIVPDAGPLHSSAYLVHFYLPEKFQASPPLPLPELNLQPVSYRSRCVAVRKFSGFARDNNIVDEAEKLAISLSHSIWANSTNFTKISYSIAQYSSPFRIIGRVNEVWADVDASGCESNEFKAVY